MLLGGVFRAIGAGDGPMAALSAAKRDHLACDLRRWAERDGIILRTPAEHPRRTVLALRTLLGLPEAAWPAAIKELFAAYWQHGEDLATGPAIAQALRRAQLGDAAITTALTGADSPQRKQDLRDRTDQAVAQGIFGAPAFVVHGRGATHLLWGQDRMSWLAAMLDGWQPPGAPPSPAHSPSPARSSAKAPSLVDFYFDVASPFAYLGLTQIARVSEGHTLCLRPILLGGLFRAIGTPDVPLLAFPEAKRRYLLGELSTWSAWWSVPFAFPRKFPQRTQTVQRILLQLHGDPALQLRLALAFARAMWAHGLDLESVDVVRTVLQSEGASVDLLAASGQPQAKADLIAATSAAAEAGIFGVPTCVIHTETGIQRFWGQDRMELVSEALWKGAV